MAIQVGHRPLGYIYVLDVESGKDSIELACLDVRAIEAAGAAIALELVRDQPQEDELAAARQEFLWDFLSGDSPSEHEIARARVLGLDAELEWELALTNHPNEEARQESAEALLRSALRQGKTCIRVDRYETTIVLTAGEDPDLRSLLDQSQAASEVRWGLARAPSKLEALPTAYQDASLAVKVSEALHDSEPVADALELEPYIMLSRLAEDRFAVQWACAAVEPLRSYDSETGRNLLQTLELYLDEGMNTSSAARRLHLNRHSLLYRLRKIESLTGRSLNCAGDRFLLELSIKLHRFGVLPSAHEKPPPIPQPGNGYASDAMRSIPQGL